MLGKHKKSRRGAVSKMLENRAQRQEGKPLERYSKIYKVKRGSRGGAISKMPESTGNSEEGGAINKMIRKKDNVKNGSR